MRVCTTLAYMSNALSRSMSTAQDPAVPAVPFTVPAVPGGKAPRRPGKPQPRAEGRPYKKLDAKLMLVRIADIENKLSVHEAKSVLLRDRLSFYKREQTLRLQAQSAPAADA